MSTEQSVDPRILGQSVDPRILGQSVDPRILGQSVEPRILGQSVDPRILELAAKLTESSTGSDPILLLNLRDILRSVAASGPEKLQKLKEDLYSYGLVQYCVLVLKQDYSRVDGGWTTGAALADVLSQCCVGLDPKIDADDFYSKLLPAAALNMLMLGRRIQARCVRSVKEGESGELLRAFRLVMDSLCWLFSGHVQLAELVLRQEHFLQLLMTDDVESGTAVMSVLRAILHANSSVLRQIPEETLHPILDELVYKLSASSNPVTGSSAARSLLQMVESSPHIVQMVGTRYKGGRWSHSRHTQKNGGHFCARSGIRSPRSRVQMVEAAETQESRD